MSITSEGRRSGPVKLLYVLQGARMAHTYYPLRRRDFANVSNETASTMITPIMICWM